MQPFGQRISHRNRHPPVHQVSDTARVFCHWLARDAITDAIVVVACDKHDSIPLSPTLEYGYYVVVRRFGGLKGTGSAAPS